MATVQPEAEGALNDDPDGLESTELHDYQDAAHSRPTSSTTTAMDVDAGNINAQSRPRERKSTADMMRTFWKRHVVVTVSHEACRDHFGRYHINGQLAF